MRTYGWMGLGLVMVACPSQEVRTDEKAQAAASPPAVQAPIWEPERVTVEELQTLLAAPKPPVVVDVRNQLAFERAHIKGALNVAGPDQFGKLDKYGKDQFFVLYCSCASEHSSIGASQMLRPLGFTNLKVLKGGTLAWQNKGLPMSGTDVPEANRR